VWAQSRTLPAGEVFRARVILALAGGLSYRQIEEKLNTSAPTIARWRMRFRSSTCGPPHKYHTEGGCELMLS
jgi:transposase